MRNIFDVAYFIIESLGDGTVSAMKLQKLCYYSHVWSLIWYNKPIFKEEFQHWVNGPVCPELFNLHKGMFYVDLKTIGKKISGERLSEDEVATVAQVIEEYGGYTAGQLSELTHSEDPWKNTKLNEVITEKAIRQFYGKEKTSAK